MKEELQGLNPRSPEGEKIYFLEEQMHALEFYLSSIAPDVGDLTQGLNNNQAKKLAKTVQEALDSGDAELYINEPGYCPWCKGSGVERIQFDGFDLGKLQRFLKSCGGFK